MSPQHVLQRLNLQARFADLPSALAHPLLGPVVRAYQAHRRHIEAGARGRKDTMHIIGITGRAGSGKDAVVTLLQERRFGIARVAFADALKVECAAAYGVGLHVFTERETKEVPLAALGADRCSAPAFVRHLGTLAHLSELSPRTVMQRWGDFKRRGDPLHWIRQVEPAIAAARAAGCTAVAVTDVRYPNEVHWLRAHRGVLWRVYRPGAPDVARHTSEFALRDVPVDLTIANDHNIDALAGRATDAFDDLVRGVA